MSFLQKFPATESGPAPEQKPLRSVLGKMFSKSSPGAEARQPITESDGRLALMQKISSFLLDNDLPITVRNLNAAHGAFSGLDPALEMRIGARIGAAEPITQEWLDETSGHGEHLQQEAAVEQLVAELEQNLGEFSKNTRTARTQTKNYNDTLEQHIDDLEQGRDTGVMIADMIGVTRTMLERSRKAEAELRKREKESRALRSKLENARRDAEIDFLTGLPNRRAFGSLLEKEFRESRAEMQPLIVAFCDIDHFKRINDTHGHDAGDRVIKAIADLLAEISDQNCHVARHGGEEFVLLFRNMSIKEAEARLNISREQMAAKRFRNRNTDEPFGQITFSGGIADVAKYDSPEAALAAADVTLYQAKEAGRNQVHVAD